MSLTKKVAYNTTIQFIGKIITTITSLIVVSILTRYLGVDGYGAYTTIFNYVSFWAILADFGFFWVLIREISKPKTDQERIFNNVITLRIVFALAVYTLCAASAFFIPNYSYEVRIGIIAISTGWFWSSLNSTYVGLFQARLEMYKSVISDVAGRLIILAGVIYFSRISAPLSTMLLIYIFGNLVNFIISFAFGTKHIKFKFTYEKELWKFILKESTPLVILSLVGLIHFKVDTLLLSIMKTNTDVGIYGVPYKILEIIILIPNIFIGNVFPILTKYYHENDNRLQGALQKTFDFLVLLGFPVVAGLIILSKPIINFIGGEKFLTASTVTIGSHIIAAPQLLSILAISIAATFLINIFSSLLTVMEKQRYQIVPMVIITLINLVLNLIFIPHFSYFSCAIITFISETIMLIWWWRLSRKFLEFKFNYNIIGKIIIATSLMTIILLLIKNCNIIFTSCIGVLSYGFFAYMLKIINKDMISRIVPSFILNKIK